MFNKRQSQFERTHIPLDLIYFNHRAIQHSTFSQAWQRGCSTAGSATVSSDNCAVGEGEGCREVLIQQMSLSGVWLASRGNVTTTYLEMQALREGRVDQRSIRHCMMWTGGNFFQMRNQKSPSREVRDACWQTMSWKMVGHSSCLRQCHPPNVICQAATTVNEFGLTPHATLAHWSMI